MMWDFDQWNVQFNHGTFFEASGLSTSELCDADNVAQSKWFSDEGPLYGYVEGEAAYEIWAATQEGGVDAFRREKVAEGGMLHNSHKKMRREEEVQGMYLSEVGMTDGSSDAMMAGIILLLLASGLMLCLYNKRREQGAKVQTAKARHVEMSYGALSA